jgi:hypothetical protein
MICQKKIFSRISGRKNLPLFPTRSPIGVSHWDRPLLAGIPVLPVPLICSDHLQSQPIGIHRCKFRRVQIPKIQFFKKKKKKFFSKNGPQG